MFNQREGERLKFLVNQLVDDKKDFYKRMGFTHYSGVSYWYGQQYIRREVLIKFCEALGITVEQFYAIPAGEDSNNTPPILHDGKALQLLITGKGINKVFLAGQLKVSRQTLDKWTKSEVIPIPVKDQLLQMYNLPGDYWQHPRLTDIPNLYDLKKSLDQVIAALVRIEEKIDRRN